MPKPRGAAANTVLQPRQPNTMLHLCTSPVTGPPLLLLSPIPATHLLHHDCRGTRISDAREGHVSHETCTVLSPQVLRPITEHHSTVHFRNISAFTPVGLGLELGLVAWAASMWPRSMSTAAALLAALQHSKHLAGPGGLWSDIGPDIGVAVT